MTPTIKHNDKMLSWRKHNSQVEKKCIAKFEKRISLSSECEFDVDILIKSRKNPRCKIDPTKIIMNKFDTFIISGETNSNEELLDFPYISNTFVISSSVFPGIKEAIQKARRFHTSLSDIYIACPTYWRNGDISDTQIGVTGKCHIDENYKTATIRELSEELGLFGDSENLIFVTKTDIKGEACETYIMDAINLETYDPTKHVLSTAEDDRTKKCQVIVFGNKDILLKLIKQIKHRYANDQATINEILNIRAITLIPLEWFV